MIIGGEYRDLHDVYEVTETRSFDQIPTSAPPYDLIVVCTPLDSPESVASISHVLDPEHGVVIVLSPSPAARKPRYRPLAAQTRSMRRLLQDSRLETMGAYGALPDPWAPEYVFPLTRAGAAFAIERYILSRRPAWDWTRLALRFGPLVRVATAALPSGLLICRLRGVRS